MGDREAGKAPTKAQLTEMLRKGFWAELDRVENELLSLQPEDDHERKRLLEAHKGLTRMINECGPSK
jgi:hypothetical protein